MSATSAAAAPRAPFVQSITTGPLGLEDHVGRVEVEVQDGVALDGERPQPVRGLDAVQAGVEVGEQAGVGPMRHGRFAEVLEHRRAGDAVEDHLTRADPVHHGHGVAGRPHVLHELGLALEGAVVRRPAHHLVVAERVDRGVATGGDLRSELVVGQALIGELHGMGEYGR